MLKTILSLLLFLVPLLTHSKVECPTPNALDDILECLKESHHLVRLQELQVLNAQGLGAAQSQLPNPSLEIETVHAGSSHQTQIVLEQSVDLGGKRRALRAQGDLTYAVRKNELAATKEEVVEEVLLNIHHLIHLRETLLVNGEVLSSLEKVIKALNRRPALNPEQEAAKLNFKLQLAELRNIIALLEDEEEEVLLFFYLNGGYRKEAILKVMEDHHHPLEIRRNISGLSLNLERLGMEARLAEEELNLQRAQAWEGVSIGPMYMENRVEDISERLYGVRIAFPLPLWQVNDSGKAQARLSLKNVEREWEINKFKEDRQKESLLLRIEKLKDSLELLPKREELVKTHTRVEALYSRGLIAADSFLESHKIWRDVVASKLELEEKILELSIQYYKLSGKLNEVHL